METVIKNPELVDTFESDDRGRIRLGKRFANCEVSIAVEEANQLEKE